MIDLSSVFLIYFCVTAGYKNVTDGYTANLLIYIYLYTL